MTPGNDAERSPTGASRCRGGPPPDLTSRPLIVDTHVHVWYRHQPWMAWLAERPVSWDSVRDDFGWSRLRAELDDAGVAELVLVQAGTDTEETRLLLELAESQQSIIGVVGWVGMSSPGATEKDLASINGGKLVGVRTLHRWRPDGEILADPGVAGSFRVLADRGLTIDLFVNDHTELPLLPPLIEAVPNGRYVINHLGRPPIDQDATAQRLWRLAMTRLAALPGVFVKFSGWGTVVRRAEAADVARYAEHVFATFGPARTMYASNWPVALVAAGYHDTFAATLEALSGLTLAEREAVLGGTARACYLTT
ncbi:amidohydrolase family protein [Amycolatopsis cynarae]|uniref:Amidohydrolase family protein n=1 Tax=Amycolatopsis cynarae TaxID=2995223 RepID=A0ABY7B9D6_9PSEU|nr:amidohydrolase family protein [Amycolatopsis sp. HUAS 11-8]WAL68766.1 amidohydrolase family protein [Amycolatopsis sp. HUAS 11-8]